VTQSDSKVGWYGRHGLRDAKTGRFVAEASGRTNTECARQEGIDARSPHAWRMNLGLGKTSRGSRKTSAKSTPAKRRKPARLVELVPRLTVSRPAVTRACYAVRCGELTIEFGEDFEDETLRRLVRVLASTRTIL